MYMMLENAMVDPLDVQDLLNCAVVVAHCVVAVCTIIFFCT